MRRSSFLHRLPLLGLPLVAVAMTSNVVCAQAAAPNYHTSAEFALGGNGGWDYLSMDSTTNRLYIGRTDRAMVVDLTSGALIGEVGGLSGAHGVAIDQQDGRGFATSGRDSSVVMFDLRTLQSISRIPAGAGADGIMYDPSTRRVLSFNGTGNSATVIDPASGQRVATIALGEKPEFAVSSGDGKVYVNLETSGEVAEIDVAGARVTRKWSIAPCEEPSGLAIDRAHHRLFSVCDGVMAISDSENGRLVTTVPIGDGPDAARFDPATGFAFSSNGGDGTVTVVHEDNPNSYRVVQTVQTRPGSRTMELNLRTHQLYLGAARYGAAAAGGRAAMTPGSFSVLVVDPG